MLLVYAIGYCQAIFVTAGIAFSHCMSTWYSSPNIEERYLTEALSSGSKSCSRKFALTSRAQLVEMNGEAEHVHLLIHYPPKHSMSSMVNSLKDVSSRLLHIERPDIEKCYWKNVLWSPSYLAASCGGHRWASSSNTLSNKRPRFSRPYIPALKDRGFTARLVRLPVRFEILLRRNSFPQ